ncbi:MAG: hypothetical protein ACFFBP_17550 [Promethearchaeota archaeon]
MLVNDDNYESLPFIFRGILEIQEEGYDLSKEHLDVIKPHLTSYDDEVQEITTKIYTNSIIRNTNLIKNETEDIISNINSFEPIVRERIISFLINIFSEASKFEKQLLTGLINSLNNDLWEVRKKIIEFLSDIFIDRPRLISEFEKDLQILLEEKDIDVIKEGLDFLLKLYMKTYSVENLQDLVKTIPIRNWISQEKIFFLITQLGIKRKELVIPITHDLVSLLDHDDYLVYKSMKKCIRDIMDYHEDIFDDTFLLFIEDDVIDNLEAIEDLIAYSILKNGFNKFFRLFRDISEDVKEHIKIFNNVFKKIYKIEQPLAESLMAKLIVDIANEFNASNFNKLKMWFEQNNHYNISYIAYDILNNIGQLFNSEEEKRRKELIRILENKLPELRFQNLKSWLDYRLQQGSVSIDELCKNFHIQKEHFIDILERLIEEGFLNAVVKDDMIKPRELINVSRFDIEFYKKWKVIQRPQENEYKINLSVQIKNISGKQISNLKIIKDYPKNLLIEEIIEKNDVDIPDVMEPNDQLVFTWWFKKYYEKESNPISSNIKVIIIYQKDGNLFTIKKKLDILLL